MRPTKFKADAAEAEGLAAAAILQLWPGLALKRNMSLKHDGNPPAPHAEIEGKREDCRRRGQEPQGAVVYVTLEPCCFTGKTGPQYASPPAGQVAKVAAAAEDPYPRFAAGGFSGFVRQAFLRRLGLSG